MIQTILFPRSQFTIKKALQWLKANGYRSSKVDVKSNFLRFRQRSPNRLLSYYTIKLKNGVQLVFQV